MEQPMKKWNAIGILTVLVIGMVLISGCTGTGSLGTAPVATPAPPVVNGAVPVTPTMTPPKSPTPTPAPVATTIQTQPARDPIIGSWLNGMDFNADGTVGGDGYTTWQVNRNQKYSYFVISDRPSPVGNNQRDVTSAEWIYNPFSDKIYRRGSSETFSREIPPSKPTTIPPLTTIQTPATAVPTSRTPVTTTTAVPTSRAPVAITTAVPTSRTPVTTTTAVPTSRTPVTTTTAVPFAVEGGTGSLFIRTGGIGEGVTVYIVRAGTDVLPIKNIFDSSGNVIESQTSGYIPVGILPDGCSERVSLTPGTYIAYLPDKYGGLPEQQFFTINDNSITTIAFMGLSYRASQGGGCGG
jgi:hypothetical protein